MLKLIGVPYDKNSSFLQGPALAPPLIRLMASAGSANSFSENGTEIVAPKNYLDLCDLNIASMNPADAYHTIKNKIRSEIEPNNKIICFGGDHSVSFPIIEAFSHYYQNLQVLHLDAHADLYDNFDHNLYSHASPFARLLENKCIQSLTQVGIRTLNTHQREQANKFGVHIVEMKDFNYDFLQRLSAPLYISLDLDVLDPAYAPGISHHEPGGMTTRELLHIIQQIPVPIVGADIVEYNPNRDLHNMTAMVAYKLFKELAAKMMD